MKSIFLILILQISLPCLALKTCSRTEACRIVEYHKLIIENGNMEAVDENNSGAGGSLQKETNSSIQELRDEASFTIASEQLCACPSTDSPCAFDNETDNSENVIQINSGTMLILCQSKERLPSCRDFRRPVVRLFKDLEVPSIAVTPKLEFGVDAPEASSKSLNSQKFGCMACSTQTRSHATASSDHANDAFLFHLIRSVSMFYTARVKKFSIQQQKCVNVCHRKRRACSKAQLNE
ncbi:hypothetical protein Tsp_05475 [Trichinella spiralis]|uniref:hypothetical protein n=1 Tax=Trichinella spiralis TaxID=6334 RepID=UPI0001EFD993|nr:hypothetical protein Tsp_05475 [Trichinella spiralis]